MQTQNYKGIVIDENCFKDDGAPLTMAMLVQGNLKEGRFGRSPAIEAVFPKFKPYHYSRIYNDEVTRPDDTFIENRCIHFMRSLNKMDYRFNKIINSWAKLMKPI